MRKSGFASIVAAAVMFAACLFTAPGALASSPPLVSGIWTGTSTSADGTTSTKLEVDLAQWGAYIFGTARFSQGQSNYLGQVAGMVNTTNANITINAGWYGKSTASLNMGAGIACGAYLKTANFGTDFGGTIALTKQNTTTPNIAGHFTGEYLSSNLGSTPIPVSLIITQSNNSLTVSASVNGTVVFNGTGTIIGNNITFMGSQVGGTSVMYATATIDGALMSGTVYQAPVPYTVSAGGAFSVTFVQ